MTSGPSSLSTTSSTTTSDFQKYHIVPQKMRFKFSVMYSFIHSPFSVSCLCMFSLPSRLQIKYQTWVRGSKMSMQQKFTCRNSAYAYGMHLQSHMPRMISVSCPCRVKLNGHFLKWADKIKPMIEKPGVILETPSFSGELYSWVHSLGHFWGFLVNWIREDWTRDFKMRKVVSNFEIRKKYC